MTLAEEFAFAAIFLASFLALRGVYGMVPMLMAVGAAGIITFLCWKLWRMIRDPSVNLYKLQFKLKGMVKPSGWMFAGVMTLLIAFTVHSGVVNAAVKRAQWHDAKVIVSQDAIFSAHPPSMPPEMAAHADRALALLKRASYIGDDGGGIGLAWVWQSEIDMMKARLLAAKLDFASAERELRKIIERDGPQDHVVSSLMWVMNSQGRTEQAMELAHELAAEHGLYQSADVYAQFSARQGMFKEAETLLADTIQKHGDNDRAGGPLMYLMHHQGKTQEALSFGRRVLESQREFPVMLEAYVNIAAMISDTQMIIDLCKLRDEKFPDHLQTLQWWAVVLHQQGAYDQALVLHDRTLRILPRNHSGYFAKAMTLTEMGRMEDAVEAVTKALEIMPENLQYNLAMNDLLNALGRNEEAANYMQKAEALQQKMQGR
jgi:tetratricopeptide (TPR) repeat protein